MRGLRLRLGFGPGKRGNTFDIADASLGTGGFYFDATNTANLYQSSAGSGVVTNGDPVGYLAASDGDNFVQATADNRPTFVTGEGLSFDATNDVLVRTPTGGAGPSDCSVFVRVKMDAAATNVCVMYGVDSVRWLFYAFDDGGPANNGSETATGVADGSTAFATRSQLINILDDGEWHTLEAQSAGLHNWAIVGLSSYGSGGFWDGSIARGVVVTSAALSADSSLRGNLLSWLSEVG